MWFVSRRLRSITASENLDFRRYGGIRFPLLTEFRRRTLSGEKSIKFNKLPMLSFAHRLWRLLPRAFRRTMMTRVAAVMSVPPGPPPLRSDGAVIAGDIKGQNGIAESGRILARALDAQGLLRGMMPLGLPSVAEAFTGTIPPKAGVIAVINAPLLPVGLARLKPRDMLKGRRVVGVWAWELSKVPHEWAIGARFVHEIWAPSRFAADAFEAVAPGRVRVVPYPLATELPLDVAGDRKSFDLPADRFIVLSAFNLASSCARKNPFGTIKAFKAAFGESKDVLLVLKLSGTTHYQDDLAAIRDAVGGATNIRIITQMLPEAELRGLIALSDVVLSLHRSEGFGLIPATAALLGRPLVATGYSGNLDFMSKESSALVGYHLIPVRDDRGVYAVSGAEWAEPDIEDAAARLKQLFSDSTRRMEMGTAGQLYAMQTLGREALDEALIANGFV